MHQALQGAPWRGCTLRLSGETRAPSRAQAPQRNHSAGSPPPGICVSRAVRCARAGWGGAASVRRVFPHIKPFLRVENLMTMTWRALLLLGLWVRLFVG